MSLERLAAAAVLGVERGASSGIAEPMPDLVSHAEPDARPAATLRQAAILGVVERAASRIAPPTFAVVAPCPAETRSLVNERVHALLLQFIEAEDHALLLELLGEIARRDQRMPPRLLPRAFAAAGKNHYGATIAAGGEAARWLAAQHPDWQSALRPAEIERGWEEGDAATQLDALRAWRTRDADAARDALVARFPELAPEARSNMLAALETGLTDRDEPFLETVLDDRRKEVRTAAQSLLVQLPGSRLAARAMDILRPLVRVERGLLMKKLEVGLPEAATPAMRRDGIAEKPPAGHGAGARAYWLEELLARTPVTLLAAHTGLELPKFVALAGKHEFGEAIVRGLLRAASTFQERAALDALFGAGISLEKMHYGFATEIGHRLGRLPGSEALLLQYLVRRELPHAWLEAMPRPWSAELTRVVAGRIRDFVADPRERGEAVGWLTLIATAADARLEGLDEGWHEPPEAWHLGAVRKFLAQVRLRRDLHTAF